MAISEELKLEIRAYYESNTLSYSKVATHFEELGHPNYKKSMENWGRTDLPKWQKNRYKNIEEAIEKLIDTTLLDKVRTDAKEIVKENLKKDLNNVDIVENDFLDTMSDYAIKELIYKNLNKGILSAMMAQNLKRSEFFAKKAKSIGTIKTHHDMLTNTYATIHGKQTQISISDPSTNIKNHKEMSEMTTKELQDLIGDNE